MSRASVNCPACKRSLKTAEEPEPGARMRCPYGDCGTVFHYNPAANGAAGDLPAQGEVAPPDDREGYDLMNELLEEGDGPGPNNPGRKPGQKPSAASAVPAGGPPMPEAPLPRLSRSGKTRQGVPGNPFAVASERSKEKLIGGKGVKFGEPRTYLGMLIGFLVLCVGYAGFWVFKYFTDEVSNAGKARADAKAKAYEDAEAKRRKRTEEVIKKFTNQDLATQPAPGGAGVKKTAAAPPPPPPPPPADANIADLRIELESAHLGMFLPGDQRQFLRLVLKISNQSKAAGKTAKWLGTAVKLTLRDSSFQMLAEVERQFEDKTLKSGEAVQQAVFFDRPALGADLTLVVTLPGGPAQGKLGEIAIPASAIQRGS